jgi:MinD-like ATPase involved in chromosome partitioning or flagellar assembly
VEVYLAGVAPAAVESPACEPTEVEMTNADEASHRPLGEVVTFYSYKGGVGRTFALANIASLMARWGYDVLCIDWDLEAPGLNFYFPEHETTRYGLYDLICQSRSGSPLNWHHVVRRVSAQKTSGRLDVIFAHGENDRADTSDPIDWERLFLDGFGEYLEILRTSWKREYDFIFIDSRTGVTDAGAICTAQMPDTLLFLLTANDQSLIGSVETVRKAIKARRGLPLERNALKTMPVISRFDAREEYKLAQFWKRRFTEVLGEFYLAWVSTKSDVEAIISQTTIPYISRWSFGERIVAEKEIDSPELISYYFSNLAALIAKRFNAVDSFVESREAYVGSARRRGLRRGRFEFDVFLSFSGPKLEFAQQLSLALQTLGLRVFNSDADMGIGDNLARRLDVALTMSKNLVLVLSDDMASFQLREMGRFLRESIFGEPERRVIPIWTTHRSGDNFPGLIKQFHAIVAEGKSVQSIAQEVFEAVRS